MHDAVATMCGLLFRKGSLNEHLLMKANLRRLSETHPPNTIKARKMTGR